MDLSGIFGSVVSALTGGIPKTIETVVDRLVPDPKAAAELKASIDAENNRHAESVQAAILLASQAQAQHEENLQDAFDKRVADLEGTASDLKSLPLLGTVMLFVRGSQRPIWGIGVGWMDIMVFSDQWHLPDLGPQPLAFWTINFLVLGFLFGERAVANILPLVIQFMQLKAPAK